jgi:hypothetical protein
MPTKPFLYDYQMDAVNHMFNGCILNGGVGSGTTGGNDKQPNISANTSKNKAVV